MFRHRHRREKALKAFAHRAAFIEGEQALLRQTVDELSRHAGAPAVALYDRHLASYRQLECAGSRRFPSKIDVDDPACVALRANAALVDLESCSSALAESGLVLPMMQQGRLAGFLVVAARPAEDYAPDERDLQAGLGSTAVGSSA